MGKYDVWKVFQEAIFVIDFVPNVESKKDNTDGATGAITGVWKVATDTTGVMKRQSWWCRQTKKIWFYLISFFVLYNITI